MTTLALPSALRPAEATTAEDMVEATATMEERVEKVITMVAGNKVMAMAATALAHPRVTGVTISRTTTKAARLSIEAAARIAMKMSLVAGPPWAAVKDARCPARMLSTLPMPPTTS